MTEKKIGIKLDVQSAGLQQADQTMDSLGKNLKDLNEKVMAGQQRGWGSEAQTKELREQLKAMQQLLQANERMARSQGIRTDSYKQYGRDISSMHRDLNEVRTYNNPLSGKIHDKYGQQAAGRFDNAVTWGSRAASGLVAFDLLNTMRSGLSTGTQMSYGYGDLAKRMAPGTNSQKYGMDMSKSLQGYGYNDTELMQSATSYGAATGRMDHGKFSKQLQSIVQTGRSYGMDLSGVTQNFASMYQSGVTGGSESQMSPQEYANLVANAVNRGNMQGKEMQVISQLQQMVQMGVASSGQAGDTKTLSAFLAMGNKTGNQAFMQNLPGYLGSINSGMTSPGGGYAGQALMMQALGGGGMGYYETQVQASKGAFGMNDKNGKTNIENVMTHLSKSLGGKDPNQQAVMFSTLFPGMNPSQAKEFIQNYTNPDGSFKQGGLDELKKQMPQQAPAIPQNETDAARNRTRYKENAANEVGSETLNGRSYIDSMQGGLIDSLGAPLVYGAEGLMAANTLHGIYKFGKGAYNFGKNRWGGGATPGSPSPSGTPKLELPKSSPGAAGGGLLKRFMGPLGTVLGAEAINGGMTDLFDWTFGHKEGTPVVGQPFWEKQQKYKDTVEPVWKRWGKSSNDEARMRGDAEEQFQVGRSQETMSPASGQALAPLVISTIVALAPYMSQIKQIVGGPDSKSASGNLSYHGESSKLSDLVYRGDNPSGGLRLISGGGSGSSSVPASSGAPKPSVSGGGNYSGKDDFIKKMMPYAMQASKKTGLPVEFILGQWGHESGWGSSDVAKQNNNFAGIKPWSGAEAGENKMYAGYQSPSDFSNGYSDFLLKNDRYKGLLDAAKNGATDDELANIMGNTGYAEDGGYTQKLKNSINSAQQSIKVTGEITVNVKQPDGSMSKQKAPITADFTGIIPA